MLASLGRQGPHALAAIVLIGIALPPVGAAVKPLLAEAVFALLCISFVRLDTAAFLGYLKRPRLILLATTWSTLVVPLLFGAICIACGVRQRWPALFLGLTLQGIAPPMMSAPAIAALLGLDATLVLVSMIASTALIPISAPLLTYVFVGHEIALSPVTIGAKLLAILGGSALAGFGVRRIAPPESMERHKDAISGLNILILFIVVAALMENVATQLMAAPLAVAGYTLLAFCVFFALLSSTALLFAWTGRERALAIALMVSQRNLGLMVSATGSLLPSLTWLYFAVCQFPIYLSPRLLSALTRKDIGPRPSLNPAKFDD
jgi:BASS family bile acid:Na+ symporter